MEKEESLADTVKTVFYAVVIAILIRTFLFEPFKIPSGSMYPTLYVGDYLFVSKYTYGYSKHSLPLFNGRIWEDMPQRGDVVVFKFPQDNKTDFIKRIVGLPGDKIKMENGRLYINGKMVEREKIEDFVNRDDKSNACISTARLFPAKMREISLFVTKAAMPSVSTSIPKRCRRDLNIRLSKFPIRKMPTIRLK